MESGGPECSPPGLRADEAGGRDSWVLDLRGLGVQILEFWGRGLGCGLPGLREEGRRGLESRVPKGAWMLGLSSARHPLPPPLTLACLAAKLWPLAILSCVPGSVGSAMLLFQASLPIYKMSRPSA